MKSSVRVLLLTGAVLVTDAPTADETSALVCSGCHRENAAVPRLGSDAKRIEAAMLEFRTGEREATVMGRIARGYSEREIAALAAVLAEGSDSP